MNSRQRFGTSGARIFDWLADAIAPAALPEVSHQALRERILARAGCMRSMVTVRASEGEWRHLAPGVTIKLLRTDGSARNMTAYIRMEPGAMLDCHTHAQDEDCLLLQGEILIGGHRLVAGDMHVAEAGTVHQAIHSPRGALLLVRAEQAFQA